MGGWGVVVSPCAAPLTPSCVRRSPGQRVNGQSACSVPAPRARRGGGGEGPSERLALPRPPITKALRGPGEGARAPPALACNFSPFPTPAPGGSRKPAANQGRGEKREASGPACHAAYKRGGRGGACGSFEAGARGGRRHAREVRDHAGASCRTRPLFAQTAAAAAHPAL